MARLPKPKASRVAESYDHKDADVALRPDVGTQAQFRKKKPPKTYRYDSSLAPELRWDGKNPAREAGEAAIAEILQLDEPVGEPKDLADAKEKLRRATATIRKARAAAERLRGIGEPCLDWAGKAERLSFDVPTLPLFVHERLSTKAILETLKAHKTDKQESLFDLFGDPEHSVTDQVLRAYEHRDRWTNRMILGDMWG